MLQQLQEQASEELGFGLHSPCLVRERCLQQAWRRSVCVRDGVHLTPKCSADVLEWSFLLGVWVFRSDPESQLRRCWQPQRVPWTAPQKTHLVFWGTRTVTCG